jgi:signal peptidase I
MSVATEKTREKKGSGFGETVKIVIQALLLALIVRTFLFQPFNIPSGSMKETLLVGDYLFVAKYAYGYSRFSFPFGPDLFEGRLWAAEPKRGDIVVFKLPRDDSTDYIKRVIGLPGDKIQMIDGVLHINGVAIPKEKVDFWVDDDGVRYDRYRETLPNGVAYLTLDREQNGAEDNTQVYEVPEGHFFMMGDNRDNSTDSRVLNAVGYVPFENLVGRAEVIFFSVEEGAHAWEFWKWPWTVRWDRMFTTVE